MPSTIERLQDSIDPKQERCDSCEHQRGVHSPVPIGTSGDERNCIGEGDGDCQCQGFVSSGRYAP